MTARRNLTILGSTGSIGINTLDVVARHPDRFSVVALAANKSAKKMLEQCRYFNPGYAVLLDQASAEWLAAEVAAAGLDTEVLWGVESLEKVSSLPEVDIVMAAIVGAAGIRPTFAAAHAGKHVLLANKETMVMAGRIFMDVVKENGATLLPSTASITPFFNHAPSFQGDLQGGRPPHLIDGFRWAIPADTPGNAWACNAGASLCSSQLGNGSKNFG
jgi:1-deoxy-D-xylulose-5-phosphate reductoisomerase